MQRRCETERWTSGYITERGPSDAREFFSSTPISLSLATLSNRTGMTDDYVVGFQDFPFNVLLKVSPTSPMLTVAQAVNQPSRNQLEP